MTAGFGNGLPLGKAFGAALVKAKARPYTVPGGEMMFLAPRRLGKRNMDLALKRDPTLLLAVDYLFWFAYGTRSPEKRKRLFEEGLEQCARFQGPIILGDIPDMRGASPKMLPPTAIPSPKELAAFNDRLRKWAENRPNVLLVPLAAWTRRMRGGGMVLPVGKDGGSKRFGPETLLQWDRLHPSRFGAYALVGEIVEFLRGSRWSEKAKKDLDLALEDYLPRARKRKDGAGHDKKVRPPASRPGGRKGAPSLP